MADRLSNAAIEQWALGIAARVTAHKSVEDSRVELKRKWPEAQKAAWRLGGHANASGEDRLLWVIGLDEEAGVIGADHEELANWWPAVQKWFDQISPDLITDLNIPMDDGRQITALYIDSSRAPYVVNNPKGGEFSKAIPWRSGAHTFAASRADVLRVLQPSVALPIMEVLSAEVSGANELEDIDGWGERQVKTGRLRFFAQVRLYVVGREYPVVLPVHQTAVALRLSDTDLVADELPALRFASLWKDDPSLVIGAGQVVVDGPAQVGLSAVLLTKPFEFDWQDSAHLRLELRPAGAFHSVVLPIELSAMEVDRSEDGEVNRWRYEAPMPSKESPRGGILII